MWGRGLAGGSCAVVADLFLRGRVTLMKAREEIFTSTCSDRTRGMALKLQRAGLHWISGRNF